MIEGGYTEVAFRHENTLITNPQQFSLASDKSTLIYTPPYYSGNLDLIDVQSAFSGSNRIPQNINLVLDGLTLLSTNPDCSNYLPLSVKVGSRVISFTDPTLNNLNKYEIIVNPRINLQTVSNIKFEINQVGRVITNPLVGPHTSLGVSLLGSTDTYLYFVEEVLLNTLVRSQIFYCIEIATRLQTNFDINAFPYTPVPSLQTNNIVDLVFTNNQALVVINNTSDLTYYIFDVSNPLNIYQVDYDFRYIGSVTQGSVVYVLYGVTGNTIFKLKVFYLNRFAPELRPIHKLGAEITVQSPQPIIIRDFLIYESSYLYLLVRNIGSGLTNIIVYQLSPEPLAVYIKVLPNLPSDLSIPTNTPLIGIGGSDINYPIVSVISNALIDGKYWVYSLKYNDFLKIYEQIRTEILEPSTNAVVSKLNRFRNTFYYNSNQNSITFVNLDELKIFTRYLQEDLLTPVDDYQYAVTINSSSMLLARSGNWLTQPNNITAGINYQYFTNSRQIDTCYQLRADFYESVSLLDVSNVPMVFKMGLINNNPISDLEIFKYILDFRIRFTNEKRVINGAKRIDGLATRVSRQPRFAVGELQIMPSGVSVTEQKVFGGEIEDDNYGEVKTEGDNDKAPSKRAPRQSRYIKKGDTRQSKRDWNPNNFDSSDLLKLYTHR